MRILLLGGTSEASGLAELLARRGTDAIFSYAGRTETPRLQPLPTRTGGFGGPDGLAAFLGAEKITHVIDATHPFAAEMSRNAVIACTAAGVRLAALERPGWQQHPGDEWQRVPDIAAAYDALPDARSRIFLAIGRQNLGIFAEKPQHFYLLRLADVPLAPPLPNCAILPLAGDMSVQAENKRLRHFDIRQIVAKDAGGTRSRAKLDAARQLGLPVILIDRPALPERLCFQHVDEVMRWLDHAENRGV